MIQEGGNRKSAEALFDNEKTLENRVSFTELLTNFAMHPGVSTASLATQKLSISLSKEWVKHAHDDITAENRAGVPLDINFEIDQWTGSTRDGSNESELVTSINSHIEERKVRAIENVKLTFKHWAALAGGILFAFIGFSTPIFFLFALAGIGYFFYEKKQLVKRKQKVAIC